MSIVGAWLVSYGLGATPQPLNWEHINPLSADVTAVFNADGLVTVSLSPSYPVPDQAISATQLLVGAGSGAWTATSDGRVALRGAAVVRNQKGHSVATLFLDAELTLDAGAHTFHGPYTIEPYLTRGWTRNLPNLDGAVQGWRIRPRKG